MAEKKAAAKPEPEKKAVPAKAEEKPVEAVDSPPAASAAPKVEPAPEPVKAGGYVLTDDTGWELEEES
jgi:hypothetical protein